MKLRNLTSTALLAFAATACSTNIDVSVPQNAGEEFGQCLLSPGGVCGKSPCEFVRGLSGKRVFAGKFHFEHRSA